MGKIAMISDDYHDIGWLLLLLTVKIGRYRLLSKKISRLIDKTLVTCPSLVINEKDSFGTTREFGA